MNCLFTFGCSFTEDFTHFCNPEYKIENLRTKYVFDFLNGRKPVSWSERLSSKLKLIDKNCGGINAQMDKVNFPFVNGNSNECIFYNFIQISHQIKKGDLVIIEWTSLSRFLFINYKNDTFYNILPNQYHPEFDKNFFDHLILSNSHPLKMNIIQVYQKIINYIASLVGFKVFYWSIDDNYYNFYRENKIKDDKILFINTLNEEIPFFTYLKDNNVTTIQKETKGLIDDTHFSENGNIRFGDLIYNEINKNILGEYKSLI